MTRANRGDEASAGWPARQTSASPRSVAPIGTQPHDRKTVRLRLGPT
jgi:hypothetical protein